jgi:hypothetical protein
VAAVIAKLFLSEDVYGSEIFAFDDLAIFPRVRIFAAKQYNRILGRFRAKC